MVRWKCFLGRVVGVTLENGPYSAHHNAERARPVILALSASENNLLGSHAPFYRGIDMKPMQSLASVYILMPVSLFISQAFIERQAEPDHQIALITKV